MCVSILHSNTSAIHSWSSDISYIKEISAEFPVPGSVGRLVSIFGSCLSGVQWP